MIFGFAMEKYECPLCKSDLPKDKYLKIVGIWAEREKQEEKLKQEREKIRQDRTNLEKERKQITQQIENKLKAKYELEKEKERNKIRKEEQNKAKIEANKTAQKIAQEKIDKMNYKTNYLSKLLSIKTNEITQKNDRIKELNEMLKKKTTPQDEGILNEFKIVEILKEFFKDDKIRHYGQGGDIVQEIVHNGKVIALILYECKKTQKFDNKWIDKIKIDMKKRNAEIGVIISLAFEKRNCGYEKKEDIHIVHPFALHHIVEMLRNIEIIQHNSKLSGKEKDERIRKIYDYTKSTEFSSGIGEIILTIRKDIDLLNKEKELHSRIWEQRGMHHNRLSEKITKIKKKTIDILKGEKENQKKEEKENEEVLVAEAYAQQ